MIPVSFPCSLWAFKPFTSHTAISIIGQTAPRLWNLQTELLGNWTQRCASPALCKHLVTLWKLEHTHCDGREYYNKPFSSKTECIRMSPDSVPPQIATHSSRLLSYLPLRLFSVENQEGNIYFPPSELIFPLIFLFGSWLASIVSRTSKWENFLGSTYTVVSDQTHSRMNESPKILLAREGSLDISKQKGKRISVLFLIKAISLIF